MIKQERMSEQGFIIILIPIIIIVVLVIIFSSGNKNDTNKNDKDASSSVQAEKAKETIGQSDAESYCQDAALLGKYIDLNQVSIISISNYNVHYQDDGSTFSKDGYPVKNLQWNGKNKSTDKDIRFSCWISGPKNNVTLHWLNFDGKDLYGSGDFESYDKDGKSLK